ncbi:hypothetical protein chiPu_0001028 [Chiloscyllium punctatum]|uniref:Uncharacterized protein n=1 Tax=Chiloscyllium punctatum TaxID=137246 RepID=A0A401RWV5_CHIPU|nr:hypothetical protein [Chiloscyllium punctatum]
MGGDYPPASWVEATKGVGVVSPAICSDAADAAVRNTRRRPARLRPDVPQTPADGTLRGDDTTRSSMETHRNGHLLPCAWRGAGKPLIKPKPNIDRVTGDDVTVSGTRARARAVRRARQARDARRSATYIDVSASRVGIEAAEGVMVTAEPSVWDDSSDHHTLPTHPSHT